MLKSHDRDELISQPERCFMSTCLAFRFSLCLFELQVTYFGSHVPQLENVQRREGADPSVGLFSSPSVVGALLCEDGSTMGTVT